MKKKEPRKSGMPEIGPTQRQLRAGENIRHILVGLLARGEIHDPSLRSQSITLGEVRMSPDLRHANIFVSPLGEGNADEIAKALNKASSFLRTKLAQAIDAKFTPKLNFLADKSYDFAVKIDTLLSDPKVVQDLERPPVRIDNIISKSENND